jgi:galactonate dehydratase
MKITGLTTHTVYPSRDRSWLFIVVETDEGIVGFGEASQSRNDAGVIAEVERISSEYIGYSPLDLIERRNSLLAWPYVGRTLYAAVSAIEQALWDLCGKKLGIPVYQLLGGKVREKVRGYANVGYVARDNSPEAIAEAARSASRAGFDSVKLYPFGMRPSGGPDRIAEVKWIELGIERIRAVREAVGPDVSVLVDLMHQFVDLQEARQVAKRLDRFDLFWIEDPFGYDDPRQLAEFRRCIGPRLAGGAPHLTRREFRPLLEHGALDVIMPDLKWLGGINEAKKAAAIAETFGVLVSPHNASGPVASAAAMHLSLSLSNFLIVEHAWAVPDWRGQLCRNREKIELGHFPAPTEPGLGIDLDMDVIARHASAPLSAPSQGVSFPAH